MNHRRQNERAWCIVQIHIITPYKRFLLGVNAIIGLQRRVSGVLSEGKKAEGRTGLDLEMEGDQGKDEALRRTSVSKGSAT